jgi:hypothetical protein
MHWAAGCPFYERTARTLAEVFPNLEVETFEAAATWTRRTEASGTILASLAGLWGELEQLLSLQLDKRLRGTMRALLAVRRSHPLARPTGAT